MPTAAQRGDGMSQAAVTSTKFLSWLRPRSSSGNDPTLVPPPATLSTQVAHASALTTPHETEHEPLRWLDAATHARMLCNILYLGLAPPAPGNILSRDLVRVYREMCAELGLAEHSWQIVSNLVRRQLGPVKTYCWHVAADGTRSRLRVFKFLRIRPCVLTDEEQLLIAPLRQ